MASHAAISVALLLDSPVPHERTEGKSIRHGSCGKDLEGSKKRPELLIRMTMDNFNDAVDGDGNEDEGKAEQQDQGCLALCCHVRLEYDRDREGNKK